MRFVRTASSLAAISALAFAASAHADTGTLIGPDPDTAAALGSDVADGQSIGAIFVNPALLPGVSERAHAGLLVGAPRVQVRLMARPRGVDVARSIYDSTVATAPGGEDRAQPTAELRTPRHDTAIAGSEMRAAVGFVSSFGLTHVRFGALILVPYGGSDAANIRTHYDDEREAAFSNRLWMLRFGEGERIAQAIAGVGGRVLPWLSVGLGVRLAATAVARLGVYVPDASVQEHAESNLETSVATSWRPIFGARVEPASGPLKNWSLGLVYRAEAAFHVDATSEVSLWNDHLPDGSARRTTMQIPLVFGYEPAQLAVGVAFHDQHLAARATATLERWSTYVDNHGDSPETLAAVTMPNGQTVDGNAFRFHDVVSLAASTTLQIAPWLATTLSATYRPSPVPPQIGRTSFVDSSIVGFALGERATFSIAGTKFAGSIAFQLFRLLPRTTYKDPMQTVDAYPDSARTLRGGDPIPESAGLQTNSPGFPGYSVEGWLLSTSIAVAWLFS